MTHALTMSSSTIIIFPKGYSGQSQAWTNTLHIFNSKQHGLTGASPNGHLLSYISLDNLSHCGTWFPQKYPWETPQFPPFMTSPPFARQPRDMTRTVLEGLEAL